ncbi:MAG: hypothetical protein GTN79_15385, partial [Gammaproteobacteria bacterium]|nr:hypothetical protein [Gammaproteobacteria bacterium]NIR21024.1 hypothetical protein [Gammaproteobacteria bacterium]
MTIYSRYDAAGSAGSFGFFVGEYGTANTKLVVSTHDGTQWNDYVSTSDVPVGTWTHVSAVYDGTDLSFYIDGAVDGAAQAYTPPSAVADLPQYIGATDPDDPSTHFDGIIDEVQVSSTAQTADWIAAQYDSMTDSLVSYGTAESYGVLANDTDADFDPITVLEVNGVAADVGSQITLLSGALLTLNADGSFSYDTNGQFESLAQGATTTDTFTYTAFTNAGDANAGLPLVTPTTVTITIVGVNDAPTATANSNTVTEDVTLTASGNLLTDNDGAGIDSDPDTGDTLSVSEIDGEINPALDVVGSYGSLNWDTNGAYTYTLDNANAAVQALNFGANITDTFTYTVSDGNGGTDTAVLTITINGRDDITFDISSTAAVSEGGPTTATFTITLGGTISTGNTASVTVTGGGTASDGTDYTPLFATSLSNAAGSTTGVSYNSGTGELTFDDSFAGPTFTFSVDAQDDAIVEGTETITATLSAPASPNGAASIITADTTTNLTDNDTATLTVGDVTVDEAAGTLSFDVSVDRAVEGGFTVDYSFTDGSATGGSDYDDTAGTLTFAGTAGEVQTITVNITNDTLLEADETFTVNLTSSNALVADTDTAIGTITDNETATVTISANDAAAAETGSDGGQFTVDLGTVNNTGAPITVNYSVGGTATAGGTDYTSLSGSVQIAAGAQTATIDVSGIVDDLVVEGDETVTVTLTGTSDAAVSVDATPATVTIADNDTATLTVGDVTVDEAAGTL